MEIWIQNKIRKQGIQLIIPTDIPLLKIFYLHLYKKFNTIPSKGKTNFKLQANFVILVYYKCLNK